MGMNFLGKPQLIKFNLLRKVWADFFVVYIFIPRITMTLLENLYVININILDLLVKSGSAKIKSRISMIKEIDGDSIGNKDVYG